ncbi:MAG: hypothetical protein L0Z62_14320 [Gemmataceae bacterium]|nr:hypothetical protein [Gemmataceae bacterium]
MNNRIQRVHVFDYGLDPLQAAVTISVYPEHLTSRTEVRGRLTGPRCPYATTVEVAYPLREASREYESLGIPHISSRVILPEPCLWDPQSPFLYEGLVELWQSGNKADQIQVRHALRTIRLTSRGLTLNGQPLTLRGVTCQELPDSEARALHEKGYNTLLLGPSVGASVWDRADRFGFLTLTWVVDRDQFKAALQHANLFREHPSSLGWIVTPEAIDGELAQLAAQALPNVDRGQLLGIELQQAPSSPLPKGVSFVVCPEAALGELTGLNLPKLVIRDPRPGERAAPWASEPGILGWTDM